MNAKRFQIYLTQPQHSRLQILARDQKKTMAALIREAIDRFLDQTDLSASPAQDPLWTVIGTAMTPSEHPHPKHRG